MYLLTEIHNRKGPAFTYYCDNDRFDLRYLISPMIDLKLFRQVLIFVKSTEITKIIKNSNIENYTGICNFF